MEPKNVKEAMTDPAWIDSMQEELLQFKRLDVWVLVPAPDNISPLTLKWLFKNKHDEEQTVIRNKSCLVVRGYLQEEGIDFEESFAPVTRIAEGIYPGTLPLDRVKVLVMNGNPSRVIIKQLCGSDNDVTTSLQLSRNSRPPMLDHQDKYIMKAQVYMLKSFAISDEQPLPQRKYHCQYDKSIKTFRVMLFSIHSDEWKSFQSQHQTALRGSYTLSWKPCNGGSSQIDPTCSQ
nr:Gag-Pol polyprotein [Tanacetum cinerariifolium]